MRHYEVRYANVILFARAYLFLNGVVELVETQLYRKVVLACAGMLLILKAIIMLQTLQDQVVCSITTTSPRRVQGLRPSIQPAWLTTLSFWQAFGTTHLHYVTMQLLPTTSSNAATMLHKHSSTRYWAWEPNGVETSFSPAFPTSLACWSWVFL